MKMTVIFLQSLPLAIRKSSVLRKLSSFLMLQNRNCPFSAFDELSWPKNSWLDCNKASDVIYFILHSLYIFICLLAVERSRNAYHCSRRVHVLKCFVSCFCRPVLQLWQFPAASFRLRHGRPAVWLVVFARMLRHWRGNCIKLTKCKYSILQIIHDRKQKYCAS